MRQEICVQVLVDSQLKAPHDQIYWQATDTLRHASSGHQSPNRHRGKTPANQGRYWRMVDTNDTELNLLECHEFRALLPCLELALRYTALVLLLETIPQTAWYELLRRSRLLLVLADEVALPHSKACVTGCFSRETMGRVQHRGE